jgi:hypothetical protein
LTELEKELFELDKKDEADPPMNNRRFSTRPTMDSNTELAELLNKIKLKIKEYSKHQA